MVKKMVMVMMMMVKNKKRGKEDDCLFVFSVSAFCFSL